MKHKKPVRNPPWTDVAIGLILELIAASLLVQQFRMGTAFWGTLFAGMVFVGAAPWTWWSIAYLRKGRPHDPLSLLPDPDADDDAVAAIDPAAPDEVLVFDQETMEQVVPAAPSKRTFEQVKVSIDELHGRQPPFGALEMLGSRWPNADKTSPTWQSHANRLADDLGAAGGSYASDPRLAPGFWAKGDDESEDDYWQRICGCQGTEPPKPHLIMCPRWKPVI